MENFGGYLRQKNEGIVAENCAYRFRKIEEYKYTHVKVVMYLPRGGRYKLENN